MPREARILLTICVSMAVCRAGTAQTIEAAGSDALASAVDPAAVFAPHGPAAAVDLGGTWAQRLVQSTISRVPVVGEVRNATTSLILTTIEHDGDTLTLRSQVCDVRVESSSRMVRTEIPSAFVAAMAVQTIDATVVGAPTSPSIDGWRQIDVLGARLSDPLGERLPDDPDDWRVMDPDRDGEPGVTVLVRGMVDGEIFLIQRGWSEWVTTSVSDDRIAGYVEWAGEQQILGSSSVFLQTQPPTEPDPSHDRNGFELIRVDAGATCETVLDRADALFDAD